MHIEVYINLPLGNLYIQIKLRIKKNDSKIGRLTFKSQT